MMRLPPARPAIMAVFATPAAAHDGQGEPVLLAQAAVEVTRQAAPSEEAAQGEEAAPEDSALAMTDLGRGLHMLAGEGGNILVSTGPHGTLIIDDQYERSAPAIEAALDELGAGPVAFVLNTHWHGDHTGSNAHFAGAGATLIAQENVRRRMAARQTIPILGATSEPAAPEALPGVTYDNGMRVYANGETLRLTHLPSAHTDGDTMIWLEEADVIHAGDVFFNDAYPVIDLGANGSLQGMIAGLSQVLEVAGPQTQIVPGHGPLGLREDVAQARDLLLTIRDRIAPLVDAGMSEAEVLAADPLADLHAQYGQGFVDGAMMTRLAYAALSGEIPGE